jgi:ATP-dependent Clp protease ATP-binding subunit ClpC
MHFKEIKRSASSFTPAIVWGNFIKPQSLKTLSHLFLFLVFFLALISAGLFFFDSQLPNEVTDYKFKVYGTLFLILIFWSISFSLYSFLNYYRFRDISSERKKDTNSGIKVSFETAKILHETNKKDLTISFMKSEFGINVLTRCGISWEEINSFIYARKKPFSAESFSIANKDFLSASDYIEELYNKDEEFSKFIYKKGLQKREFVGASKWINDIFVNIRKRERWWSEENIAKFEPVGTDWAYGVAYELEKFAKPIESLLNISESLENFHKKEVESLELILSRTEEANALLIGEAGTGKMTVIGGLASKIKSENTTERLLYKKILVLDTGRLMSLMKEKADFEKEFIKIMNQTAKAGNVILVIDNLPYLINGARSLESDVVSLLEKYLSSPDINVLALSDKNNFHNLLEPNTTLMSKFEYVILEKINEESILSVLEEKLLKLERENKIMFTFPALLNIVSSANRYFPGGVMPDKAVDLLIEITPQAVAKNKKIIDKKDIEDLVRKKTGIPVGDVDEKEKKVLLNLEEILHKKIVGQNQAVEIISNALRRARSGISNPDRPLGSFLFLGPTGVGKTETAKALAEIFFDSSQNMSRLDMSEYQGQNALNQLIGSFDTNRAGRLSSVLREKPYSVLLLDEFEKASKEIHNLFLQTLDEGVFTDSTGKEVNARNSIIIATSNAGSEMIWEYEDKGEDLKEKTSDIVDYIIEKGIFSPELLNRFDGIIVFHSLQKEHLRKIAKIEINNLTKRVKDRGVIINITDDLVDYLIEEGTDPKFGARDLNRTIQEKIEKVIAEKIIEENPKPGSVLNISLKELK